ncbi:ATPase [Clostridium akagii]|uniref:ATPase n=1 Tax=Clostridium akagii TaxID=91623 RepID=UPI00047D564D|nr:ATPase [Clostridium akagii]
MNVIKLLEYLEEIVDTSSKVPITGKILVNKKEIIKTLDDIMSQLPDELKKAQWVLNEKDKIISDALKEAEKIRQKNVEQIMKDIQSHDISKEAKKQADKIISDAQKASREIQIGSREYASEVLADLDREVKESSQIMLSNVKNEMDKFLQGYQKRVCDVGIAIKENTKELKKI